jgi:hypothetical protein
MKNGGKYPSNKFNNNNNNNNNKINFGRYTWRTSTNLWIPFWIGSKNDHEIKYLEQKSSPIHFQSILLKSVKENIKKIKYNHSEYSLENYIYKKRKEDVGGRKKAGLAPLTTEFWWIKTFHFSFTLWNFSLTRMTQWSSFCVMMSGPTECLVLQGDRSSTPHFFSSQISDDVSQWTNQPLRTTNKIILRLTLFPHFSHTFPTLFPHFSHTFPTLSPHFPNSFKTL